MQLSRRARADWDQVSNGKKFSSIVSQSGIGLNGSDVLAVIGRQGD